MGRAQIVILSALVALSCATSPCVEPELVLPAVPKLGEHLGPAKETCVLTMSASAQWWPSYGAVANGIKVTIGIDEEQTIRFLATRDAIFESPEHLRIGDTVAAALQAAPGQKVMRERGWGHHIQLPSGWFALLDDSKLNLGTADLGDDARVTMFFMRN